MYYISKAASTSTNMSPLAGELRVLERCQVSPPPGTVPESTLPLTFFDILWLHGGSVERVFFYPLPHSTSYFIDSILPSLKSSLSLALQHFYPLAGRIRRSHDSDEHYEIHYVDGDSISFTVAEHDGDFDDLSGSRAREAHRLLPLSPQLPKPDDRGKPLLALQVTVFPNQGVAVGVAVHHAACDGSSSIRFMSAWSAAACARPGGAPPPPIFDRSLISHRQDLYSIMFRLLAPDGPAGELILNQSVPLDAVIGSFALGGDHIRRLKELVCSKVKKATEGGVVSFHCSTIVVTYAYVWVCLVKTRAYASDRIAYMGFAADCRGRLRPPVPAAYFGNCLSACLVEAEAGDLTGEDGVAAAARIIGEAIDKFKDGPLDGVVDWPEKFRDMESKQLFGVAGSPKFRVYDLDFGWGRPKKVDITSIMRTGAMSVAESREEEGGVEIGLVLPKLKMNEFETHFSNGLKQLQ